MPLDTLILLHSVSLQEMLCAYFKCYFMINPQKGWFLNFLMDLLRIPAPLILNGQSFEEDGLKKALLGCPGSVFCNRFEVVS